MKAWGSLVLGAFLLPGVVETGEKEPLEFDLSFGIPCEDVDGSPGEAYVRTLTCLLHTRDEIGAEGWRLGFAAEGVEIVDVTQEGTAGASVDDEPPGYVTADGFQMTGLVAEGEGDCAGRSAAASVVVLSASGQVTLPGSSYSRLARFKIEGVFPGRTEARPVRLEYVEGCRLDGSGPVQNEIQWSGRQVSPNLDSCELRLVGPRACPLPDAPLQVVFQTESVDQTEELFSAQVPTVDPALPAEVEYPPGTATLWAGVVSQLEDFGVSSWDLAIACEGDLRLTAATVQGTVGASDGDEPPGLRQRGFEVTTLVDPGLEFRETGLPQGQGVVSAVVLSFTLPVALEPRGTATVLGLTIEGEEGDRGALHCRPGLRGAGTPVENMTSVGGLTQRFACCQWVNVRFGHPMAPFHRGDVNDDGEIHISDPIRLLQHLFLGAPAPGCVDAGDFNDDAAIDTTDVIGALQYLYLGGAPPPAPGPPPEPCGTDPGGHAPGACVRYDSC